MNTNESEGCAVKHQHHCYGCEYSYDPALFDGGCLLSLPIEKIIALLNEQPDRTKAIAEGKAKAAKRGWECR